MSVEVPIPEKPRLSTSAELQEHLRQRMREVFASDIAREYPYSATFLLLATDYPAEKIIADIPSFKLTKRQAENAMRLAEAYDESTLQILGSRPNSKKGN